MAHFLQLSGHALDRSHFKRGKSKKKVKVKEFRQMLLLLMRNQDYFKVPFGDALLGNLSGWKYLLSLPLLSPIKLNDVLEVVCPLQPLLQPRGGKSGSPLLGGGNDDDDDNKMGAPPGFLKRR